MKQLLVLLLIYTCFSCAKQKGDEESVQAGIPAIQYDTISYFDQLLHNAGVRGSILIYNAEKSSYYSNDFERSGQGFLPASTFKIPNSIIALETAVVENDSSLFKWDGKPRRLKVWEQDLTFHQAFHFSCVPCYQEIARTVGVEKMRNYLQKFKYGTMQVDSLNIDRFWLEGSSIISQFEQIDFLRRFYDKSLPISTRTDSIMRKMMLIDSTESYKLSGKTGWVLRNDMNIGWFVAFIEKDNKLYYVATNIEPLKTDMPDFPSLRKSLSIEAFRYLKILPQS